jgi:hypothetical protein
LDRSGGYRLLVGRFEGKKPFGRYRCRWENNFKMYLKKWEGVMDCIEPAQYRGRCVVNAMIDLWFQ